MSQTLVFFIYCDIYNLKSSTTISYNTPHTNELIVIINCDIKTSIG